MLNYSTIQPPAGKANLARSRRGIQQRSDAALEGVFNWARGDIKRLHGRRFSFILSGVKVRVQINRSLISIGVAACALGLAVQCPAEEAAHQVLTAVSSTTLSGYVSTSAIWSLGSRRPVTVFPVPCYLLGQDIPGMSKRASMTAIGRDTLLVSSPAAENGSQTAAPGVRSIPQYSLELRQAGNERISVLAGVVPQSAPNTLPLQPATAALKAVGGNIYALAINQGTDVRPPSKLAFQNGRIVLKP